MTALAIVGDWNGTPHDRGRWSPSWLATQAGLRIASAGPGRHGDIDYAMTDANVGPAGRRPPPGPARGASDHDVYVVKLTDTENSPVSSRAGVAETAAAVVNLPVGERRHLWLASWNMRVGRSQARVRSDLHALLTSHNLHAVVLQEAADYHAVIREVAASRGYVVLVSGKPGQWHQVILSRVPAKAHRFVQLSPRGWRLVAGGEHAELWATSWLLGGWLRVVDVHLPPSVNWSGGRIRGPVMRVAAYVAAMVKLRRWARNWHRRN